MAKKSLHLKVKELKTGLGVFKDLELVLGKTITEPWEEPQGPTPFPSAVDLREWDLRLLSRYKPFYLPFCDLCCLCTMGKCDLTRGKKGACGLDLAAQQSRIVLLACCMGAATHASHARHLVEHLSKIYGKDRLIQVGTGEIEVEAPVTRLVCGIKPKTLGDLDEVLNYVESQITHLLSATHTGQEGDELDFESKVFHAGMVDQVAMEVADIAQVSAYPYPKADPEAPLADIGFGSVDASKPVILVVGHNVPPAAYIMDYLSENNLQGSVEVAGICCTAHDLTRYNPQAKIIGPISWQLRFIRSGVPDVVVVDEQCIRTDLLSEAEKVKVPFIASTEKQCAGLRNRTGESVDEIVNDLAGGKTPGALILDPAKVGEVAVRTAMEVAPKRRKFGILPGQNELVELAKKCTECEECRRACPNDLPIPEAVKAAASGVLAKLADLCAACIGCARCEDACPQQIPIHSGIVKASEEKLREEAYKVRVGRGAIQDVEIRKVGGPLVLGEIPGVIALVGCANYPSGGQEVAEMAEEFLKRRFIVVASGCAAMSIGMYKNEDGQSLYEAYPGVFDAGGLVNVGSCVANSHIAGAAIKIASIFARRNLRGNYEEIADYIHNRVGAAGIAWGAMSQKAASIASGFWRLGVPVVVGPHGSKYRRMLLGRKDVESDWYVYDARTGEKVYVGPVPEHLFFTAETKEEAVVMLVKLCMRANDTAKGRAIKLAHYVDLHKRYYGVMPDDLHLLVRKETDIPITLRDEVMEILKAKGWRERETPDPTLLERLAKPREAQ